MRSPTVDPAVEDCSDILATEPDPIIQRLEDQISWYNCNSVKAQRAFRAFKITEIIAAALIPFVSGLGGGKTIWIAGGLGVVVTVIEGVIHLNQYQQNWITYRSTCEALKHEKYLHLGKAGSYASAADPHSLLAERVESLVLQEHAKWAALRVEEAKSKNGYPAVDRVARPDRSAKVRRVGAPGGLPLIALALVLRG